MSHLFVFVRMTAHINIRGRIKFATPPSVLCSVLLFHNNILNLKEEGHKSFHYLFVPERSERNDKKYEKLMLILILSML